MANSTVAPCTFIIKLLNIHCTCNGCKKKLKKLLQNIRGVSSIAIDGNQGTVTVSGTVDPHLVIMTLENDGKTAELLWDQSPQANNPNLQIVAQFSKVDDHQVNDQDIVAQLKQLNEIKGLKQVEITSKNIKLTFKDEKDVLSNGNDTRTEKIVHETEALIPHIETTSSSSCSAIPCCHVMKNNLHDSHNHCCHIDHATCCSAHSRACSVHNHYVDGYWSPPACGCTQPPRPSAPPWPLDMPSPQHLVHNYDPPPVDHPYTSMFSDENPGGCRFM